MLSLEQKLEEARTALIHTINNSIISSALAPYGYDANRLQEGLALCQTALTSLQTQASARSNKKSADQMFQELWKESQANYTHDMQIVRMVFKNANPPHYFLGLQQPRTLDYTRWHAKVRDFYHGLSTTPTVQTLVAAYGLTLVRIEKGIQLLEALETARLQRQAQTSGAVNKRRQRDEVFKALDVWMVPFRHFARLALTSEPELLASLGIKPLSYRRTKKDEQPVSQSVASSIKMPLGVRPWFEMENVVAVA